MGVHFGSNVTGIHFGGPVSAVYFGSELVWRKAVPLPYTELQYINWVSGSGWSSDIAGNAQSYDLVIDWAPSSVSGYKGLGIGTGDDLRAFGLQNANFMLWEYNGHTQVSGVTAVANQKYSVGFSWRSNTGRLYMDVDGAREISTSHYVWTAANHVNNQFSMWGIQGNSFTGRVYGIKETVSDVLTHNWIPVRRTSDSAVCLYDTVSETFITSTTATQWTAGPDKVL